MSDDVLTGFVRLGVPLDFFGRDFTTWLRAENKHPLVGLEVESRPVGKLQKRSARGEFDGVLRAGDRREARMLPLREQLVPGQRSELFSGCRRVRAACAFSGRLRLSPFRRRGLKRSQTALAAQFRQPDFRDLWNSAAVEGMGITVLARALVAPPMRVVRHGLRLPQLPSVELVYSYGRAATRTSSANLPIISRTD